MALFCRPNTAPSVAVRTTAPLRTNFLTRFATFSGKPASRYQPPCDRHRGLERAIVTLCQVRALVS